MTQPTTTPGDPAPTTDTTVQQTAPAATPAGDPPEDRPLGPAGERALREEREARRALERRLAALAPLERLAAALAADQADDGRTDVQRLTERLDSYERQIAEERQARWRAEVAAEKGLPAALAARLQGSTREELAADADALLLLIPAAPATPAGPRIPAPDPTQGPRGPVDIDALIREAEARGDVRESIRLKAARAAARTQQR